MLKSILPKLNCQKFPFEYFYELRPMVGYYSFIIASGQTASDETCPYEQIVLGSALLNSHPEIRTGNMSEGQLGKLMSSHLRKVNSTGLEDFDGLSPVQMHHLLDTPLSPESLMSVKVAFKDIWINYLFSNFQN